LIAKSRYHIRASRENYRMEEIDRFTRLIATLHDQPVLTLFLILGMGYLIGNIRIGSFSLGPVAGVLFAGLFLGHFDFRMSPGAQSVGFALFIFSVGYQAGPRFFDVLRTDGLKYFSLAVVSAATGFTIAVIAAKLLELSPGTSAGLLSGGLTSSPTLAAAQEALRTGQVQPPAGITADAMIGNVATGYAITYIFGLAGLIAIIKLLPQVLGIDLEKEAKALESKAESAAGLPPTNVSARIYRVTNEEITKIPGKQLREQYWDKTSVVRVRREGEFIRPGPEDFLRLGDELYILAPVEFFTEIVARFGEEIMPDISTAQFTETAQVVVINKKSNCWVRKSGTSSGRSPRRTWSRSPSALRSASSWACWRSMSATFPSVSARRAGCSPRAWQSATCAACIPPSADCRMPHAGYSWNSVCCCSWPVSDCGPAVTS
jgi:putative transport protein